MVQSASNGPSTSGLLTLILPLLILKRFTDCRNRYQALLFRFNAPAASSHTTRSSRNHIRKQEQQLTNSAALRMGFKANSMIRNDIEITNGLPVSNTGLRQPDHDKDH